MATAAVLVAMIFAAISVIPAAAMTDPGMPGEAIVAAQETNGDGQDVLPMVLWTMGVLAVAGVVLGTLYLLKRRVGGFPENPTWTAPITVMLASENATEETFGLEPEHASHGSDH